MLRRLIILVATAVAVGSCGSEGGRASERGAGIYAAVIRALVSQPPGHPDAEAEKRDRVVYAGPLDEKVEISLEVQVAVVEELEAFATIRFVDGRNEAIDDEEKSMPVREDGVLLLLGTVPEGSSPQIAATRYVDVNDVARFRVTVAGSEAKWKAVQTENVAE